jgi:hypothetical protein
MFNVLLLQCQPLSFAISSMVISLETHIICIFLFRLPSINSLSLAIFLSSTALSFSLSSPTCLQIAFNQPISSLSQPWFLMAPQAPAFPNLFLPNPRCDHNDSLHKVHRKDFRAVSHPLGCFPEHLVDPEYLTQILNLHS